MKVFNTRLDTCESDVKSCFAELYAVKEQLNQFEQRDRCLTIRVFNLPVSDEEKASTDPSGKVTAKLVYDRILKPVRSEKLSTVQTGVSIWMGAIIMDGCLLRVQLRATLRGMVLIGFQLAVCQYLDLVSAAFGNKFTPLRYGLRLTAQCLCQFVSATEVVNCVLFLHHTPPCKVYFRKQM